VPEIESRLRELIEQSLRPIDTDAIVATRRRARRVPLCRHADRRRREQFLEHRSAPVLVSFPGVGALTGARLLAEIGDDEHRFAASRALKAYAGAAPITRASGHSH
jgi:transposase